MEWDVIRIKQKVVLNRLNISEFNKEVDDVPINLAIIQ